MESLLKSAGVFGLALLGFFAPGRGVAEEPLRVGQIILLGNRYTRDQVILNQLPFRTGDKIQRAAITKGATNLRRLGLFEDNPANGARPTIEILAPEAFGDTKDLLVHVEETEKSWVCAVAYEAVDFQLTWNLKSLLAVSSLLSR
jgi:hypothetical protein